MSKDPSLLYAWRCDDCGEKASVDSSDEAEAGAKDHRTVTRHGALSPSHPRARARPERPLERGRPAALPPPVPKYTRAGVLLQGPLVC